VKIVELEAFYPRYGYELPDWRPHLWQVIVKVTADTGDIGWGWGGGGEASLPIINGHYRELLRDREVGSFDDISAIWDDLYRAAIPYGRRGIAVMALSGVDLALWDLLGRAERKPVYELLGGARRPRVRAYGTGRDPKPFAEQGFSAFKLTHRWRGQADDQARAARRLERARELMGSTALLMVDSYMSWDASVTRVMAEVLAPYQVFFFEDVTTPEQLSEQAALRGEIRPILLAGGEHEFTHYGFAEVAAAGALDIWQPDIAWCGGITAGLRILELAKNTKASVIPHRGGEPWGLHFIVATDCEDLAESNPGRRGQGAQSAWVGEPEVIDGFVSPRDEPGFGLEPNQALL
jgi:L-rhamnonate dehydratase